MKTFKHKTNGSIMTYRDGCMQIDNLVIEGTPNLNYWEEVKDHSIMLECIKRFPKGSRVIDCRGKEFTVDTEFRPSEEHDWFEGTYYYGYGEKDILALEKGKFIGFYLYKDGKFAEKVVEKDYEILSFYNKNDKDLFIKKQDGLFYFRTWGNPGITGLTEEDFLDRGFSVNTIHSIKRLSDGQVFSVGDKVRISKLRHDGSFIIDEFYFDCNNDKLLCNGKCTGNGHVSITKIEKVKKSFDKDYEILSFTDNINNMFKKDYTGAFTKGSGYFDEQHGLKYNFNIHSIKRLSDGEVFSVGDKCKTCGNGWSDTSNILNFEIRGNHIHVNFGHIISHIKWVNKVKQPLFSTKESVEKYTLLNEPCLSIQDVIDAGAAYVRLKKIVKERLWKS